MTDTFRIELNVADENLRLGMIRQNQDGGEFIESVAEINLSKLQVPCRCADSKAKIHASTIEAGETRNEFRATLNNATSQYDPASFEAGEQLKEQLAWLKSCNDSAHALMRHALKLPDDAPRRHDYYASLIDDLSDTRSKGGETDE